MRYSRAGYWGRQAAAILLTGVAVGLVLWVIPAAPLNVKLGILAATSVIAVAIALSSYRKADEVILETHKAAWFWGSMAALGLVAPLAIAITAHLIPTPSLLPHMRPCDYFVEGGIAVLVLQCAGFVAFWVYYNVTGRR